MLVDFVCACDWVLPTGESALELMRVSEELPDLLNLSETDVALFLGDMGISRVW